MTGVPSYSTTASENVQANTGINWDEGMSPAAVNNSARQNMADMRSQWNDASWFQYGTGSKSTVEPAYGSSTSFTIAGTDVTAYWHANRRVKAVGSSTGTIYGSISSSSFSTNTTVNVTWDSGSLSNEALTVYASTTQVTGKPIHSSCIAGTTGTGNMVLSTSPTLAAPAFTGAVTSTGGITDNSVSAITQTSFGATAQYSGNNIQSSIAFSVIAGGSGGVVLNSSATAWAAISDETMKTSFVLFSNALDRISQIKAGTGRYLTDDKQTSRSFLSAQSVQAVLPEAVTTYAGNAEKPSGWDGKLTLSYTDVIPLLVAALAEAKARIEALEAAR